MKKKFLSVSALLPAAIVFVLCLIIALLPKSPIEPFHLPPLLRRVAGEIGDKYWWVLLIGGLWGSLRRRPLFKQLIVTLLVAQIIIGLLKWSVGEMRPDGRMFHSFPSGHTTATFAFATVMSQSFRWGWLWFPFGVVVGVSRILVRAHWWHDVVGGAALGYLVAIGLILWQQKRLPPSQGSPQSSSSPAESGRSMLPEK